MTPVADLKPGPDAQALKPGDRFVVRRYAEYGDQEITVRVLREQEPCKDIFGRDMIRYWCTREDTGAEGYMIYGPGACPLTPA